MKAIRLKSRLVMLICLFTCIQYAWSAQDPVKKASPAANAVKVGLCGISPAPEGSTYSHEITLSELLALDSLCVQNGMVQSKTISGYHLILVPLKGYLEDMQIQGNQINDMVQQYLKKLPPGSVIIFENITATETDGTKIKLSPISILLK